MRIWYCLLCLFILSCLPVRVAAESVQSLTVFAAASLKESMDEVAVAYEKYSGVPVRTSYAASSTLARQIEHGAPVDVFISADLDWMDYLQDRGKIDSTERRNLLGNTLVIIAPVASNARVDLTQPGSLRQALGRNGRLAVGQTNSVPAGKYARTALHALGHWDDVVARLAEVESVRSALMLVARAEAPLGIVYGSDARAEPRVRIVATFPAPSHAPIVYPVAPVKGGHGPHSSEFVQWLGGHQARGIFINRGFSVID